MGGYKYPAHQTPWQEIQRNIVDQLGDGAVLKPAVKYQRLAQTAGLPREAYFVRCDRETTTQNDINLGIVNIVVGFAPLKPAEFVVIKLQQMAGQIAV